MKALQLAEELSMQIQEDTFRQQMELDQLQRTRKRGMSDATQVPVSPIAGDTPTEMFGSEIEWDGVVFNTVKLFHPRKGLCYCIIRNDQSFNISHRFDGYSLFGGACLR